MDAKPLKPASFTFPDWRNPQLFDRYAAVEATLNAVAKEAGTVPFTLDEQPDRVLRAFAVAALITITDEDIEPAIFFPNKHWASREFVRQTYKDFIAFCVHHGWLTPPKDEGKKAPKGKKQPEPAAA